MASSKKRDILGSITHELEGNSNFALISFAKATHKTLEGLRKQLRAKDAHLNVVKNTIFEKAINKLSEKETALRDIRKAHFPLKEKTALLVFKGDWADGLKTYYTAIKADETFGFKFGHIDSTVYSQADMVKLSQLPGKNELIAKLLGVMKNPMVRTTRALSFNMQQLVYVLDQRSKQS